MKTITKETVKEVMDSIAAANPATKCQYYPDRRQFAIHYPIGSNGSFHLVNVYVRNKKDKNGEDYHCYRICGTGKTPTSTRNINKIGRRVWQEFEYQKGDRAIREEKAAEIRKRMFALSEKLGVKLHLEELCPDYPRYYYKQGIDYKVTIVEEDGLFKLWTDGLFTFDEMKKIIEVVGSSKRAIGQKLVGK